MSGVMRVAALVLGVVLALVPGMATTAYAGTDTYKQLIPTGNEDAAALEGKQVTFNGYKWYIIEDNSTPSDAGSVTLFAADLSFGSSKFADSSNVYNTSTVKSYLDNIVAGTAGDGKPNFASVASAMNDSGFGKLYLLAKGTNNNTDPAVPQNVRAVGDLWWLRSPGLDGDMAAFVLVDVGDVYEWGIPVYDSLGVRPALQLNLSSVIFKSENNSFELKPAHTHSFSYSANGATITATCNASDRETTCPLKDKNYQVSLTLSVVDATYTRSAYTGASLSDTTAWTAAGLTAPTIEYAGRSGTSYPKSTTAPTNVGTYTASITVGTDKIATADFTIRAMPLTITGATATMSRLYNPNTGEHLYTSDTAEHMHLVSLGWQLEGEAWQAPTEGDEVYRLYNPNGGDHHYTVSEEERDALVELGWIYEGVAFYSDPAKGVAVYREYNPNEVSFNHNYTADKAEHDHLVSLGWQDEGVAWYGVAAE